MTRAKKPKPITHEEIVARIQMDLDMFETYALRPELVKGRSSKKEKRKYAEREAAIYREAIRRLEEWSKHNDKTCEICGSKFYCSDKCLLKSFEPQQARRARRKP